jgi:ABC-2 type transport system permease protein
MKNSTGIFIIAKKEFREALRDKLLWLFAAITWVLIALGALTGWQKHKGMEAQRAKAAQIFRHEWEEQEANPHSAAHFGTYLFKPSSVLEIYDHGLNNFLGNTYRVEAHVQHEVNHSEAENSDTPLRFGELSVSLVFQLLLPLMILLISFNAISKEREGNTLKVLLMQRAKPSSVIWGKLLGIYAIVLTVVLPALLLLAVPFLIGNAGKELIVRYLLLSGVYLVYFLLFTGIGLTLSAISKTSQTALASALGLWIVLAILLPRATTRWIDSAHPLPSRYDFNRQLSQGYQQGLDKDGNITERRNNYLKQTLQKYKVDSISKLPVNFDGLSMQFGEDYNSKVYDHLSGKVEATIGKQQEQLEHFSLLNPFQAIQQLSMGLTGTDYFHHLSFHHQAKEYRDNFVRQLNMSLANSGSSYLSYDFTVGPGFFRKMKDFRFKCPTVNDTTRAHRWAFLSLAIWTIALLCLFVPFSIRQVKI